MNLISKRISLTLKALRQAKGWSLDKAAQNTGVSKAMLGQIEREESSPTIVTLWKIASGFDTPFSVFIDDTHQESTQPIYRAGPTQEIHPKDEKMRVKSLFPFDKQLHCEMFLIELLPNCEHLSSPHQPGVVEHVIVAEGGMEMLVNRTWHFLKKGEGLRFEANQPHGYRNLDSKVAIIHNIIHYPMCNQ